QLRRLAVGDEDLARIRLLEPGDHAQQSRLAGAARAEQGHQRAALHADGDIVQRNELAEALGHAADLDRHQVPSFGRNTVMSTSVPIASRARRTDAAYAPVALNDSYWSWTCSVSVSVLPTMRPETTLTAPNSPSARAVVRTTPYAIAQRIAGSVTRRKIANEPAPSVAAASSWSVPISRSTGTTSRTTNGSETKIVATTIPGSANSTCT